ncbi:MAG: transposase, partial [Candidatus Bipolaricaulia bacterium]
MSIYLGIDVGSEEHALYFLDEEKDAPVKEGTITNNSDGFKKLEDFLFELGLGKQIRIGLEATGNYWKPLFNYLRGLEDELDITLSLINP